MKQELDPHTQVQLRYRDIDPDSGLVSSDGLIGQIAPKWANALLRVLQDADADEPNREYYLKQAHGFIKSEPKPERATQKPEQKERQPKNNGYTAYGDIHFGKQPKNPKI